MPGKRVLVTFLGTGNYQSTTYLFSPAQSGIIEEEVSLQGRFAGLLMAKQWKAEKILVLATEEAKAVHEENFKKEAESLGLPCPEFHSIPSGRTEEEFWQVFRILVESIPEKCELVLDITHSFRSIPLIGLTAVEYIKRIKAVSVQHIWYGAYQPDASAPHPVIDLTLFSEMLEWVWAVRSFTERGETAPLAALLPQWQKLIHDRTKDNPGLKTASNLLNKLHQALLAIQPIQIGQIARDAESHLENTQRAFSHLPTWSESLLNEIQGVLKELALPESPSFLDHLQQQWRLIQAYIRWGKYTQAVILAREWVINWYLHKKGREDAWQEESTREEVARELHDSSQGTQQEDQDLLQVWGRITSWRNKIAHCGMSSKSSARFNPDPNSLKSEIEGLRESLENLWNTLSKA